jgi:hypothetical protein
MNKINFENFKKIFDTEQKCINLLIENNYIQTTYCCNCNSNEIRKLTKAMKNNYMCKACKKVSNIFKNTVFFNSFVSLVDWFYIIHLFLNLKELKPDRIAKETKRSWTTIDKVLKKINKAFENQEIKEKFNFLLDINLNDLETNANNLSTATESDKNFIYYDLYSRIVHQYTLLKYVRDTFAINKKYDFEYDFVDAKLKDELENIYLFLDMTITDLDKFFRNNFSFIDKIETLFWKFKNKEFIKLELFDDYVSCLSVGQHVSDMHTKEHGEKHFNGDEVETYDPKNLVTDLESCKNYDDEVSQKEYLLFQEIINESKKIIKIK